MVKKTYVADGEQDEEEEWSSNEDLEEEGAYEAFLEGQGEEQEQPDEEEEMQDEEDEAELEEGDLMEAYAAGWKAKAKMSDKKKSRGYGGSGSKGKERSGKPMQTIEDKKKGSTCSSCGGQGHWRGDPECPKVKAGIDPIHQKKPNPNGTSGKRTNYVNFTYAVTTMKKPKTGMKSEGQMTEGTSETTSCPTCRWPTNMSSKFCSQCGAGLNPDQRMTEGKRGWTVVVSDDEKDELITSSGSSGVRQVEEEKIRTYALKKERLKEAAGLKKEGRGEKTDEIVKATPAEVLSALPSMTKAEKKELRKTLAKEEQEIAYKSMARHQILMEGMMSDSDPTAASSGRGPEVREGPKQLPIPKSTGSEGYMEKARDKTIPKAVKDKMLLEFRMDLYKAQEKRGRLIVSRCAPAPTEEQLQCKHPFEKIRWSANGDGHYGTCRACGLKHVIYFSEKHGAMMVGTGEDHATEVLFQQHPGQGIVDSGCRTAVAGIQWHEKFQAALKEKGLKWHEEEENEMFKFGAGAPEKSCKAYLYPIGIHGFNDVLRMSCVSGGAADCPGLIGPSELARWGVMLDFAAKEIVVKTVRKPMHLTSTRHPALNLMDYANEKVEEFWKGKYIQEILKILQTSPQTWAFVAEEGSEEDEESSGDEKQEDVEEEDSGKEEEDTEHRRHIWTEALEQLHRDLEVMPLLPKQEGEAETDDGSEEEHQQSSGEESISSHEFGVEIHEESSEEEDEDRRTEEYWNKKWFSKGQKSDVGHSIHVMKENCAQEINLKRKEEVVEEPTFMTNRKSKGGKWKVLEVFTWTCMISLCALETGRWQMLEPITLPHWNLLQEKDRKEALEYIDREDPDLLVLAWPCTVWSTLQTLGKKTEEQLQRLAERRQEQRILLDFCFEASKRQRSRGGALLGENPWTSKAWKEEAIIRAFEKMSHGCTEMCAYGLKKPQEEDPWSRPLYLRKKTGLAGTAEIVESCNRRCPKDHVHAPVLGGVRLGGRWMTLSDFAGGYTADFAKAVLRGAETYLRRGRQREVFVQSEVLAEEGFCPAEDEEDSKMKKREEEEDEKGEKDDKKEQLMIVHRRLGHPTNESLARMLRLAGAEKWLIEEARGLDCPTCQDMKPPSRPMTQRSDMRPTVFNELLGIDLKYCKDVKGQLFVALSVIDLATNYHRAVLLRNRNPEHVAKKFMNHWISIFGTPVEITLDQGGEWEAEFLMLLEQHSVATRFTGSHAAWQLGHAERHGALIGVAWSSIIHEKKIEGREGMKMALLCAQQAKNAVVTRRGYSANALVFGRQCNFPDLLDDESSTMTTMGQALSQDTEVARQAEMRAAGKRALLHQDAQEKLKRALTLRPKGRIREFLPGEKVFFWVPNPAKKTRYRGDPGLWRGPAMVITKESNEKYFVSWRGRCLLLASANMRGATIQDNADQEGSLEEIRKLEEQWSKEGRQYEDASGVVGREEEEPRQEERGLGAQEDVVVPRRQGRTRREAVQMMKGLKSVRKVLKQPFVKGMKRRGRPPKVRTREEPQEVEKEKADEKQPEMTEGELEEFWKEVHHREDEYSKEEELRRKNHLRREQAQRMTPRQRSLEILDDVPVQFKRKRQDEDELLTEEETRKKFKKPFFDQIQVMVSDAQLPEKIRKQVQSWSDRRGAQNQWISRSEVKQLSKLLDMPITAARLHRTPRKRMQKPPQGRKRGRLTVMLLQQPGEAMVVQETENEVKEAPRKRAPSAWRGLTMFTRTNGQDERKKEGEREVYLQVHQVVYKVTVKDEERWQELKRLEERREVYHQVLALQLKSSGKELDPRWFNEEEAKHFADSDLKEWEAWVKNGVIERLTPKEAEKIPKSMIFRAPLRMVRVNKSKEEKKLQAKSRLVVPGHLDPGLGEYRSDSPTTSPTAVRMIKTICVTQRWKAYVFDVSTAFLSGKHTQRQVFVRAPPEGLPATSTSKAVGSYELMRIVKGAYGLSEAPRLWYLRAVELLEKANMIEIPFCRATFLAKDGKGQVYALCALHVDDGFFVGDPKSKDFWELKKKIDQVFNIKAWEPVDEKGVDYLGMKVIYKEKEGIMIDDMTDYVEKISPGVVKKKFIEKLSSDDLTNFRQLVMRMRWPCQHVLPEYMYRVSALAQSVSRATYGDLKDANTLLEEMKGSARNGLAKLTYRPLQGEVCFVTFFDASLGKKKDGTAQQGEIHFMTDGRVTGESRAACIIEYHSNKISRVVRSSMAAESCALAAATDKQLYNRLLYRALQQGQTEVPTDWREKLTSAGYMITDAKSLFDHCHKTGGLAQERQTALDLLMVKGLMEKQLLHMKWVPTFRQLADSLTKSMKDILLTAFKQDGKLCIVGTQEDELIEQKRSLIRKGQRERRNARIKKTISSQHSLLAM